MTQKRRKPKESGFGRRETKWVGHPKTRAHCLRPCLMNASSVCVSISLCVSWFRHTQILISRKESPWLDQVAVIDSCSKAMCSKRTTFPEKEAKGKTKSIDVNSHGSQGQQLPYFFCSSVSLTVLKWTDVAFIIKFSCKLRNLKCKQATSILNGLLPDLILLLFLYTHGGTFYSKTHPRTQRPIQMSTHLPALFQWGHS